MGYFGLGKANSVASFAHLRAFSLPGCACSLSPFSDRTANRRRKVASADMQRVSLGTAAEEARRDQGQRHVAVNLHRDNCQHTLPLALATALRKRLMCWQPPRALTRDSPIDASYLPTMVARLAGC